VSSWYGGLGPYASYANLGLWGTLVPYGSISLTAKSPPQSFIEPLTVSEVRTYLKLPLRSPSDPAEDDELMALIMGARIQAEIAQHRDLVVKQWDLSFDYWLDFRVNYQLVMRDPLISVDLLQYMDFNGNVTQMVENTDFVVDRKKHPGVIMPPYNQSWPVFTPWPSSAILARFTSGFTNDDPWWSNVTVKIGMRLLISHWFHNRIPFVLGQQAIAEYPLSITSCLSDGAIPRVY